MLWRESACAACGFQSCGVLRPLNAMLNTFDFESVAREAGPGRRALDSFEVMEPQAWGYYSSGGDDEITLRDNHMARSCMMRSLLRGLQSCTSLDT